MIKSSTTNQELRLQRAGQSPATMESLKTSFLPNLSMDTDDGVVNALYCPMCGQHYPRHQLLAEHMQICHNAPGDMMLAGHADAAPPPASLKIEYPCLSCDDKFPSAQDLDEHNRIAHQAFLARCVSCGLYGISSSSLEEGSSGGEYKCMHCGAICTAAALAGQEEYLEQQSPYMDSQSQADDESPDDDYEEEEVTGPVDPLQQLKVPPLTVKLPKNSDSKHPHVIIKQEPGSNSDTNTRTPPPQEPMRSYSAKHSGPGNHASVVVSANSTIPVATGTSRATVAVNKVRYKCPECPKTFKTPGTLATHKKVHTGEAEQTPKERPYSCTYCGKSFTQSNTLKQHTRIHTGEKPFHCSYCEKSFSVKDYLTKHIRTHTGEKPYSCSYCDKKFTQRSALTVHTTKLHPL